MPERVYTSVTALSDANVDIAGYAADEINAIIADVSAYIEVLTNQVFNPLSEVRDWDGRDGPIAFDPEALPIIDISSIAVNWDRTRNVDPGRNPVRALGLAGTTTVIATEYVVKKNHGRFIERVRGYWPLGPRCLSVTGVFGWLDPVKAKVETTTTADLVTDDTTLQVTTSVGYEIGDVILVGDARYLIVTSIPDGTHLNFSDVGTIGTISSGVKVQSWGMVPRAIRSLASHLAYQFIEEDKARADAQRIIDAVRIRKEMTDGYSYELFSPKDHGVGLLTGSVRHDMTIRRYGRPAVAQMI